MAISMIQPRGVKIILIITIYKQMTCYLKIIWKTDDDFRVCKRLRFHTGMHFLYLYVFINTELGWFLKNYTRKRLNIRGC